MSALTRDICLSSQHSLEETNLFITHLNTFVRGQKRRMNKGTGGEEAGSRGRAAKTSKSDSVTVGSVATDDIALGSAQVSREHPLLDNGLFERTLTLKIVDNFEKNAQAHGAHVTDQGAQTIQDVINILV